METMTKVMTLRSYADGRGMTADDFEILSTPMPEPAEGNVLVQVLVLSVDPALRGSMMGRRDFYNPQFELGQPIHSRGVGRVISSRHPDFKQGDLVKGRFAWAEYAVAGLGQDFAAGTGLALARPDDVKLSHHLGVLGNTGETAFFGIVAVAKIRPGDSVLISAAAGGVGSVAGQLARIMGARQVVGLAGSQKKCEVLVRELGFDAAVNYRSPDLETELDAVLPGGPSVYFDNVGGRVSQLVMGKMPRGGRVVECGQISTYDEPGGGWQVDIRPIHRRGLSFTGFTRPQFAEFFPAANAQLAYWLKVGKLKGLETERSGFDQLPEAFLGMLKGDNLGKMTVTIAD
jgi:NADPH-dependent curcumin reductase CurA